MKYKFDIHLSDDEVLELNKFIMFSTSTSKKGMRLMRLMRGLVFLTVAMAGLLLLGTGVKGLAWAALCLIALTWSQINLKAYLTSNIKRNIQLSKPKNGPDHSQISVVEFHDDFLVEAMDTRRLEQKYSSIKAAYITDKDCVYIFLSDFDIVTLPSRVAKSEDEWQEFLAFIKSALPGVVTYPEKR